jgi:hypothetical protein
MKTKKTQPPLLAIIALLSAIFLHCDDTPEWSKDYDIQWPLTTIESVTPLSAAPGTTITLTGKNMHFSYYIYIGAFSCEILTRTETTVTITVPDKITGKSPISVYNLYRRTFVYPGGSFIPILQGTDSGK